ncbi:MAG: hypothetical protein ACLQGP_04810 [Isosphaeraceae bacterium]
MIDRNVQIVDESRGIVALARVLETDGIYSGSIDLRLMPEDLLRRFESYDEIVNSQMFGLLDEVEEQLAQIPFVAMFEDGNELPIEDLQIYPSEGRVSFKVAKRTPRHDGHLTYSNLISDIPQAQAESRNPA